MPGALIDRLIARIIDGVILAVVVWGVVSSLLSTIIIGGALGYRSSAYFVLGISLAVLGLVINLGYYAVLETRTGQTVGKMVMKLRVQGPDGQLPTIEQSLRRNAFLAVGVLGTVASNILGIVPVVGGFLGGLVALVASLGALALVIYIAYTINEDADGRQGWHDRFAGGTQVMKEAVSPAQS